MAAITDAAGLTALDLAHYWQQSDAVSRALLYLLLAMSVASWFFIFSRSLSCWRVRRAMPAIDAFWDAPTLDDGIALLTLADSEAVFAPLAAEGAREAPRRASLAGSVTREEQLVRALRRQIARSTSRIERGLSLLASIGATAPFVGLLGTVWGIHHALAGVARDGGMQLDTVAGPVGAALIMTGVGLAVAIPAVLAYNAFNRLNRATLAQLDGFAYDLHAYFIGKRA